MVGRPFAAVVVVVFPRVLVVVAVVAAVPVRETVDLHVQPTSPQRKQSIAFEENSHSPSDGISLGVGGDGKDVGVTVYPCFRRCHQRRQGRDGKDERKEREGAHGSGLSDDG